MIMESLNLKEEDRKVVSVARERLAKLKTEHNDKMVSVLLLL